MVGPDPEGNPPDGWTLEEWEAYGLLKSDPEETYASVAKQIGRSTSTVSRMVRRWRDRYGPDVYVSPRSGKLNVSTEKALEGARNGGAVIAARWADRRVDVGNELGTSSKLSNDVALAGLQLLLEDPARLSELSTKDLLNLARFADLTAKRADLLVDAGPVPDPMAGGYGVDLSGLEAASSSGHHQETLQAVEVIYRQYRKDTGREIVDVDS